MASVKVVKTIKIKFTNPNVAIPDYAPKRASSGAAAFDLIPAIGAPFFVNEIPTLVPLGFSTEFPEDLVGVISLRGSAARLGLVLCNAPGIIDSDFRGEWQLLLRAIYPGTTIEPFRRIAQVVFLPLPLVRFQWVDELPDTERGSGMFGSTGR